MNIGSTWRRIGTREVQLLLNRPNLKIFDMRDQASYEQGHIEGAEYLSNSNLEEVLLQTPRHDPVLIYCYHGNASQSGAKLFADFGFQEVYDLIGGFESWRANQVKMAPELCSA